MKNSVKRALAIAAVAPFGFIGMVGSASAAVDYSPEVSGAGTNLITVNCDHPGFPADELALRMQIRLEHNGTGRDFNDIEWVRITATDNQGHGIWDDNSAHVDKMRVRYFSEDANFEDYFNAKPFYAKSKDGKSVKDGRQTFGHEKDNVGFVEVKVTWHKAGHDDETLLCGYGLGGNIIE